jgi:type I restriction enzyme, S subunit
LRTVRLLDVCEKIGSGATPRGGSEVYLTSGVTLIRSQNVYNDGFKRDGVAFIDAVHADELSNVTIQSGDILLNITGDSVARVCQVPDEVLPARVNQHVAIIRPRKDHLDARYLRYFLASPQMQKQMLAFAAAGATRNALTKGMIESFEVPAPPVPEQKAIARILGSLDDKIELNRRMNETLEALARALFKSWFIDFDPVRARAEGRAPAGMDAETAALFPDSFEETELGMVPRGWRIAAIGDVVKVVGGSTPSTENPQFWNGVINFATPKDLASATSSILLDTERRITEKGLEHISSGLLPKGTVLLSSRAPIGYLAITEIPVAVNQGFIALICDGVLPNYFVMNWIRQNMDTIIGNANGTTFLEISKRNFRPIPLVVPSESILNEFFLEAEALYSQITCNLKQTCILVAIRNALLPMLLSGDIRVMDVKTTTEEI